MYGARSLALRSSRAIEPVCAMHRFAATPNDFTLVTQFYKSKRSQIRILSGRQLNHWPHTETPYAAQNLAARYRRVRDPRHPKTTKGPKLCPFIIDLITHLSHHSCSPTLGRFNIWRQSSISSLCRIHSFNTVFCDVVRHFDPLVSCHRLTCDLPV